MKLGDMVDFRSPFFGATTNKQRPGIIIEIDNSVEPQLWEYHKNNRASCKVLWANGRTTNEYYSLLEHYDDIPRFS